MGKMVNKTTLQLTEGNEARHSNDEWWYSQDMDMNIVNNVPQKYWINNGGELAEMTQAQKTAKDKELSDLEEARNKKIQAEQIILENMRKLAIQKGVDDGKLNNDGSLK